MWEDNVYYILYLSIAFVFCILIFNAPHFVKYYLKFGFYIVATQIISLFILPIVALSPRNIKNIRVISQSMKHITKVLRVTWEIKNEKVLREEMGAVIVVNHQSSLDIFAMYHMCCVGTNIVPVCKKDFIYMVPFGFVLYLSRCIFIDRSKPKDAHHILKSSADPVFENKTNILIFPEGTRNKDPVKMQPFKKGAFILAIACQVPIIPVVISPYYFLDRQRRLFNKGHVTIQCLESVPTAGLTMDELPELMTKVQNSMELEFKELRAKLIQH